MDGWMEGREQAVSGQAFIDQLTAGPGVSSDTDYTAISNTGLAVFWTAGVATNVRINVWGTFFLVWSIFDPWAFLQKDFH